MKITIIDNLVSFNLPGNTNHRSLGCGDKILILNIPDAYLPISVRDFKLKIFLVNERGVVRYDNMIRLAVLTNRAVKICSIKSLTPGPLVRRDICLVRKEKVLNGLGIHWIVILNRVMKSKRIIISHMLSCSSSHTIVMLINAHAIKHSVLSC